jgi:hypothetical protein
MEDLEREAMRQRRLSDARRHRGKRSLLSPIRRLVGAVREALAAESPSTFSLPVRDYPVARR